MRKSIMDGKKKMTKHERPWGYFEVLAEGPGYKVKRLVVNPGKWTSLQWHELRDELWHTVQGKGKLTLQSPVWKPSYDEIDTYEVETFPHTITTVNKETLHRIHNEGTEPLVIIEIQTSDDSDGCREDDVHRIEDDFGREVEKCVVI